ncbi:hypothetical protein CMU73_05670 [Elizabethkingia anophelis]|nr:hypothetical protein [Elizabethkingia anophelis]MCT4101711.1 hypothetical protein [Elizabethkingia anophelis]MCT4166027.1 hypothetical protein [Elizabethkingia anophelis]MDV3551042.1 hypothetical protein [Elizabethkingia anophelis]MDV3570130.1 hypothetical protein [Elizabethkingia anophelis]
MMETPKQQAIKAAYGEMYDSKTINKDGWQKYPYHEPVYDKYKFESKQEGQYFCIRPKSLSGIETNNSWTRIESEEDLPKDRNIEDLLIFTETGEILVASSKYLSDAEIRRYWIKTVSHWQKFVKPNPPIF